MGSLATPKIQRIAIIGGGPSGICTAKYLLAEKVFSEIHIYEQGGNCQGAWNYTSVDSEDQIDVPQLNPYQPLPTPKDIDNGCAVFTTPMYDRLETNIPHQMMSFASKPFPEGTALFPPRAVVSQYLEEYAAEIKHLVKFNTQVQDICLEDDNGQESWHVKAQNLITGQEASETYDAVAICSGHYDLPFIPDVPGIAEFNKNYPGVVSHSKFYRDPTTYTKQKVVIIGNSASGMDIANQIAEVSKHPLIISARSKSWLSGSRSASEEERILTTPQIVEYLNPGEQNRAVRFADGSVEKDIDKILYCTGYLYSFPFLSSFLQDILRDGTRVHEIYRFIFHMHHPSLAFVGLPIRVLPFPLAEMQAAAIAKVWSDQIALPPINEMQDWQRQTVEENGEGKRFLVLDNQADLRYHNDLYDWIEKAGFVPGCMPHRWTTKQGFWLRPQIPAIKKAYADKGQDRFVITTLEELGFVSSDE